MKKILVVTDNLMDQVNGVVTTFTHLKEEANKDGYEMVFIDPSNFKHWSAPGYPDVKLSWPKGIGKLIDAHRPCYIHIATEGPLGFAARLYCDRKRYIYNTSYHTKFPEYLSKMYHVPEFLSYAYLRWFHKHSGKVLTTTDTMVKDLQDHGFKGDIVPWTRGFDTDIFNADARTKVHNGIHSDLIFLYVGRVSKEKGLDDFCNVKLPGVKIIVGDGPYRKELEEKYPEVMFEGVKRGKDLAKEFANADVFVFPSRTDTFGIVMIEAIACGTPVAAYPVAGPIDVVTQEVNGYLDDDLDIAIKKSLLLSRDTVLKSSKEWTWKKCWDIFHQNLCEK